MKRLSTELGSAMGGIAFSVLGTLAFLLIVGMLPGMEIPLRWMIGGALCAAVVSTPVCVIFVRQRQKIILLHRALSRAYAQLELRAGTDQLTGLANRDAFFGKLGSGVLAEGWIVLGDLDNFKRINDTHGHATGDLVLAGVGQAILATVRTEHQCARMGGEEFAIFLQAFSRREAMAFAERLRLSVARHRVPGLGPTTISLGLAPTAGSSLSDALRRADEALYDAKRNGRDCAMAADDPDDRMKAATALYPEAERFRLLAS